MRPLIEEDDSSPTALVGRRASGKASRRYRVQTICPPRSSCGSSGYQLEWEITLEITERARRRFSLEREGMLMVTVEGADEDRGTGDREVAHLPTRPRGSWSR